MADDEHLKILKQGVEAWNDWRGLNPDLQPDLSKADLMNAKLGDADLTRANLTEAKLWGAGLSNANLKEANLTRADLSNADLTRANLTEANLWRAGLSNAKLGGADLTRANLTEANLTRADLTGAKLLIADLTGTDLTGTDLTGADFMGAKLRDAIFVLTPVNGETRGLDRLTEDQKAGLVSAKQDPYTVAEVDAPSRAAQITVGASKRILGPAHEVLIGLAIPNDLSEAHRDLFLEFRRTVADLKRDLAGVTDQNKLMSGEIEALKKVQKALPVWRETWTTFIAAGAGVAAGTVGASAASYAAGYTAGFIAGVLHDTFSPDSLCIMT